MVSHSSAVSQTLVGRSSAYSPLSSSQIRVRAGRFWVNCIMTGGPEMPLGGFKQSGWGREAGTYGVEEYTQVKSVHVEIGKRSHWIK